MKNLKHIALFLDLTEMDDLLLGFVRQFDKLFDFETLTLVHLVEIEEMSKEILDMLPFLDKPIEKVLEEEMRASSESYFGVSNENISIHVQKGGRTDVLVDWLDAQKFDLLIMGKKTSYEGSGIFSSKIVRLADSSVLFIPETARPTLNKVVVPIDFSRYTSKLIDFSVAFSQKAGSEILPIHIIRIGIQYFPYIKNESEIKSSMEKKALLQFDQIKKKHGLNVRLSVELAKGKHISQVVYNFALKHGADLVIIGKKGKTDDDDLLLGSVAERLIANDKNIAVLIVK